MGMLNPQVNEALDKLTDVIPEGQVFTLLNVRTVTANTDAYGKGEMVVVRIAGHERELGVWGAYLLHQAKSVSKDDYGKRYRIERKQIAGFGKGGRPVKAFVLADDTPQTTMADAA